MSASPLYVADDVRRHLDAELPEYEDRAAELARALLMFAVGVSSLAASEALSIVSNHITNDMNGLLIDCHGGRGREAMRSARSLFEHLVTACDLLADPALEVRYLDHRAILEESVSLLTLEEESLQGNDRKAFAHHRAKLGKDASRRAKDARSTHGSSFGRSWHTSNLLDRASRHGLVAEYDFYRVGSAVLHGSAGGVIGTARSEVESIHRLGLALALAPPAMRYGTHFFRRSMAAFRSRVGDAVDEADRAVQDLVRMWPDYRRVLLDLDETMWPTVAPPGYVAVVLIPPAGPHRWYIHDVSNDRIREAEPPETMPTEQQDGLDDVLARPRSGVPQTMALLGVALVPRTDRAWRPDIEILGNRRPIGP